MTTGSQPHLSFLNHAVPDYIFHSILLCQNTVILFYWRHCDTLLALNLKWLQSFHPASSNGGGGALVFFCVKKSIHGRDLEGWICFTRHIGHHKDLFQTNLRGSRGELFQTLLIPAGKTLHITTFGQMHTSCGLSFEQWFKWTFILVRQQYLRNHLCDTSTNSRSISSDLPLLHI